jgi:internalin A
LSNYKILALPLTLKKSLSNLENIFSKITEESYMLKMINKTLVLCIVGTLFSVHTQCMNDDDPNKQRAKYGDNCGVVPFPKEAGMFDAGSSICLMATGEPETPLPKSDVALQISYEYLLYEFCSHQLDDEGSRAKEDSRKNKEYYKRGLTTPTHRAFSVQPNSDLKNQLGHEIEEWLVRHDKEYAAYKAASTELQKREGSQQKSPLQRNEIRFRIAEQRYNAILNHFVKMHGPTEVMLGEREATEKEIASIKQIIYSKKKPSIIVGPRAFYSSGLPVGTPYFESPDAFKVQGFILEPRELPRAYERLKKRVEVLTREQEILKDISVYYHEEFLTKVKGWSAWQLANWMDLPQIIATAQMDVKGLIEKKYPLPPFQGEYARDRTTDQGEVLACINRDERGQQIRVRLSKVDRSFIERSHQDNKASQADHFFAKIYCGEDELESNRTPEGCHIDTKYPHSNPVTVQFEKVKTRKYILDEERYRVRLMLEPTPDDYSLLKSNELALSLKKGQLYCKETNNDEIRINTLTVEQVKDFWLLKHLLPENLFPADLFKGCVSFYCGSDNIGIVLPKNVYQNLQKAVQENKSLAPEDRRTLLDHMLLKKCIFRTQGTWAMCKNTQMVEEYPSLSHVFAHKMRWAEVVGELQEKHNPIITDPCRTPSELANGYNIITSYEDLYSGYSLPSLSQPTYLLQELTGYSLLYKDYKSLLSDHIKLLREMHQPFGSYTYVPEAIKLLISEAYAEKPSILPVIPPQEIILKDASIRDDDLQKKRLAQTGYEYMLYCYLTVDLSNNFLTGSVNYHFSQFITTLILSNNHITSLKFLAGLSALKILDLSNNMISDLSDLLLFPMSVDQGCRSLQALNLSNNEIVDAGPLSGLKVLRELDVSNNNLKTLRGLYQTDMASTTCDIMPEDGILHKERIGKPVNASLLISLKANFNVLEGNWKTIFPEGLRQLTTLEIKGNANLNIPVKRWDFFGVFPALQTFKTDAGDENQMGEEPVLINLSSRSLHAKDIAVTDKLLTIGDQDKNTIEQSVPLFYCMSLNLSDNVLIGIGCGNDDFFSDRIVKFEIRKILLCDLIFIKGFPNLTYLDVSINQINEVSPLGTCLSLKYLNISSNSANDLTSLVNLTSLEILEAKDNGFQKRWQDILPKLPNLGTLDIRDNKELEMDTPRDFKIFFPILKRLNIDFMLDPRDWSNS